MYGVECPSLVHVQRIFLLALPCTCHAPGILSVIIKRYHLLWVTPGIFLLWLLHYSGAYSSPPQPSVLSGGLERYIRSIPTLPLPPDPPPPKLSPAPSATTTTTTTTTTTAGRPVGKSIHGESTLQLDPAAAEWQNVKHFGTTTRADRSIDQSNRQKALTFVVSLVDAAESEHPGGRIRVNVANEKREDRDIHDTRLRPKRANTKEE